MDEEWKIDWENMKVEEVPGDEDILDIFVQFANHMFPNME